MFIHALPVTRKSVPGLLPDPVAVIRAVRDIVETHKNDDAEKAVTGQPLLCWPGLRRSADNKKWGGKARPIKRPATTLAAGVTRVARVRCGACPGCPGPTTTCSQPVLPPTTTCAICRLDGWFASPRVSLVERPVETNSLMECSVCGRVVHPTCETDYGVEGVISGVQPNTWYGSSRRRLKLSC